MKASEAYSSFQSSVTEKGFNTETQRHNFKLLAVSLWLMLFILTQVKPALDKQGCGEMIAEIQRLKDVLGRIILVSHQEEVADAFPNDKYLVELVDGTSRASLMAK